MRLLGGLLFSIGLLAQEQAPLGVVRGDLLEYHAAETSGELSIRSLDNHVFRFLIDLRTYIERERERIPASRLRRGETLEILSDRLMVAKVAADASLRYARIVHVVDARVPQRGSFATLGAVRRYRSPTEHIAPRGELTFTGIISHLDNDQLFLRTRMNGEKIIALRQDTRYLESGFQVEPSSLVPNTRVFIRAGRNFDNEIEAYQIVWGEILTPAGVQ